jgi:hypothetical protein
MRLMTDAAAIGTFLLLSQTAGIGAGSAMAASASIAAPASTLSLGGQPAQTVYVGGRHLPGWGSRGINANDAPNCVPVDHPPCL